MRKLLALIIAYILMITCISTVTANSDVTIIIDGERLECAQPPFVKDGVVLIRLFDFIWQPGYFTSYDPRGNISIPLGNGRLVRMSIDSVSAQYQDEFQNIYNLAMEMAPLHIRWDIYIPICDVVKCVGASSSFDSETKTLQIDTTANIQYFNPDDRVIHIFFDGEEVKCDPGALMRDDRIIIPIRAVSEAMKYNVDWNENTQTAAISNEYMKLEVLVNGDYITQFNANGSIIDTKELDVPAQIIKDRMFVPVRAVSECFGARVTWSPYNQTVYIQSSTHDETHDSTNSTVSLQCNNSIGGLMTYYDGWIYYSYGDAYESEGKGIWKIRSDGSEKTLLTDDTGAYLNIVDGWLYYGAFRNTSKSPGRLYRIKLDGTNKQSLNDTSARNIVIVNGWIYYNDFSGLYKVRLDGCDLQRLTEEYIETTTIFVQDDYIYYKTFVEKTDGTSSMGIVRIKTNGTDYTVLTDNMDNISEIASHGSFTISNEWIYYKDYDEGDIFKPAGTWRMRLDGSEKTLLTDLTYTSSINVIDGRFYGMTKIEGETLIEGELRISNCLTTLSDTRNIKVPYNLNYVYGAYEIDGNIYFMINPGHSVGWGIYILNEQEGTLTRIFE